VLIVRPARPEDAAGLALVHADSWWTTYQGLVPDSRLASLPYAQRQRFWEWPGAAHPLDGRQ
jgi:hypothetical protein